LACIERAGKFLISMSFSNAPARQKALVPAMDRQMIEPAESQRPTRPDEPAEDEMQELVAAATAAREAAYAPYSGFAVGAALRAEDGTVHAGCNIENASYGLSICAERVAVFTAVSRGVRRISAIAIVTANGVTPCGSCRQVLAEFGPQMMIIVADMAGRQHQYTMAELLPDAFSPTQLSKPR
jgi:cytidine deaminase